MRSVRLLFVAVCAVYVKNLLAYAQGTLTISKYKVSCSLLQSHEIYIFVQQFIIFMLFDGIFFIYVTCKPCMMMIFA
jgi:hypothetical protein